MIAFGKSPERITALLLSTLMLSAPYLSREGPFILATGSGFVLIALVALSLWYTRWWLIGATSLQLVVFSTHLAPVVLPQSGIWSAVTLRLILWELLIIICIFAIGECRWASYAKNS